MKSRFPYLTLFALALLVLAGCAEESSPAATGTSAPAAATDEGPPPSTAYPAGEAYPASAAEDESGYPPPYGQVLVESENSPTVDPASIITRELDNPVPPDAPVPTPEPERATVTGRVRSSITNEMLQAKPVRLAEVYENEIGDAAFVLDGANSPGTLTDVNGRFIFQDIEPRDYVLVVGNVETNDYEIIAANPTVAQVWTAEAGQILDVGEVVVELD